MLCYFCGTQALGEHASPGAKLEICAQHVARGRYERNILTKWHF